MMRWDEYPQAPLEPPEPRREKPHPEGLYAEAVWLGQELLRAARNDQKKGETRWKAIWL